MLPYTRHAFGNLQRSGEHAHQQYNVFIRVCQKKIKKHVGTGRQRFLETYAHKNNAPKCVISELYGQHKQAL